MPERTVKQATKTRGEPGAIFLTVAARRQNSNYTMPRRPPADPKLQALRSSGCLNRRPQRVTDAVFTSETFFDARDLVQVKYEMLRRARMDGASVATSAEAFGFSRPSFYQAQAAFENAGVLGLVPAKPGPRRAHKLSEEVVDFLEKKLGEGSTANPTELARMVKEHFGLNVHPRSIERALARREKKRRVRSPSR